MMFFEDVDEEEKQFILSDNFDQKFSNFEVIIRNRNDILPNLKIVQIREVIILDEADQQFHLELVRYSKSNCSVSGSGFGKYIPQAMEVIQKTNNYLLK